MQKISRIKKLINDVEEGELYNLHEGNSRGRIFRDRGKRRNETINRQTVGTAIIFSSRWKMNRPGGKIARENVENEETNKRNGNGLNEK